MPVTQRKCSARGNQMAAATTVKREGTPHAMAVQRPAYITTNTEIRTRDNTKHMLLRNGFLCPERTIDRGRTGGEKHTMPSHTTNIGSRSYHRPSVNRDSSEIAAELHGGVHYSDPIGVAAPGRLSPRWTSTSAISCRSRFPSRPTRVLTEKPVLRLAAYLASHSPSRTPPDHRSGL
jgi:hypothetical protein